MKLVRCALVLFLIFQVGLLGTAVSTLKPHRLAFTARGWVYYLQPGAQIARKLAPGEYPALRPDGMAVAYLRPSTSGAREVTLRLITSDARTVCRTNWWLSTHFLPCNSL